MLSSTTYCSPNMSSHLNAFSDRYGMRFRYDAVMTSLGGFNVWNPDLFAPAPLRALQDFVFLTSCSIDLGARLDGG